MSNFQDFKQEVLQTALQEATEPKLKIRKVNDSWYRIVIEKDKWDIDSKVVDIYKTRFNEWSINEGEPDLGMKVTDKERWVFVKISKAKVFAMDLAQAIKDDKPWPEIINDKYDTWK